MKRSQINYVIDKAHAIAQTFRVCLPEFAYFTVDDWLQRERDNWQEVVDLQLGWDITDFGRGDFNQTAVSYTHLDVYKRQVWQREAEGSTGFENHIAIPHGKSSAVINTTLAIGQMCIRDSDSRQREWLRGCNGLSLWKPDVFLPGELSGISGWLSFEQVHLRKIY